MESNRTLYEGLLEKLKEAGVTAGLRSNNFRIIDAARVPTAPSEPNIPRNLSFALVLGSSPASAWLSCSRTWTTPSAPPSRRRRCQALPSLGMIPLGSKSTNRGTSGKRLALTASKEVVETVTQIRPQSQMAESYRALRTSLLLSNLGAPPKGDHGNQRATPGGQDHHQHQHRHRARAKGGPGSPDGCRLAPPQYSQDAGHGPAQRSQQRAHRKRHRAADDYNLSHPAQPFHHARGYAASQSRRIAGVLEHEGPARGIAASSSITS